MSYLEGVRIDFETADFITRLTLIDSLEGININIASLENQSNLKDYMKEDLDHMMKYRESLLVVIEYFSSADQMAEMLKV